MELALVFSAIAFFAVGLSVGLWVRRHAGRTAALEAQQASERERGTLAEQVRARDEQVRELRAEAQAAQEASGRSQARLVELTGELAHARAQADQAKELKASLELAAATADRLQGELRAASMRTAELTQAFERLPELERELRRRTDELAALRAEAARIQGVLRDEAAKEQAALREDAARAQDALRAGAAEAQQALREAAAHTQDALRDEAGRAQEALARRTAELEALTRRDDELTAQLADAHAELDELGHRHTALVEEKARLASELEGERRAALERAADAERSREQVRTELETLAGRLLDDKAKAMLEKNQQGLDTLLTPLRERLKDFEARVEKTYDQENRDRASLLQSLKQLHETQTSLHRDAESLARALSGESRAQGEWGELVLERLLETAGLTEGREYALQAHHVDEDGSRRRPDAVVYLPERRAIVVDAKCSLHAFVAAMQATTDQARDAALDEHVASVRKHVKELSDKAYQDVLEQRSLDFVMMFVPSEPAFHAAIVRDPRLYEYALEHRVILCSATSLLAAMQVVNHLWRAEKQNLNALKIADEAGKLVNKLAGFVEALDQIGDRLGQAQDSFLEARNRLSAGRGNVLERAKKLVELGARVKPDKAQALLAEPADDEESEEEAQLQLVDLPPLPATAGRGQG